MKILFTDYTFTASAQDITLNTTESISLENVLLITNVTSGSIIYNFSNPAQGGTISNNVLHLDYNTGEMSDLDALQIYLDLPRAQDIRITNSGGIVNTKQLSTQVSGSDVALVTNTVIHGKTTAGGGAYVDVKVTPSGALTTETTVESSALPIGASTLAEQQSQTDVLGATSDAAVDTDTTGTLSGKLRGLVKIFSSLLNSVTNYISTNIKSIGGTAIDTNSGNKSAGTQRVVLATDQPNLTTPLNTNVTSRVASTPNNTANVSVFGLASTAASSVAISSAVNVNGKVSGVFHVRFGRRSATAAGAGVNIRIEGSYATSGDNTWNPLAIFTTNFAACEAEAVSGTVSAGTNVITVASTTNLTAGDVIFIDNSTIGNSEWGRIKSIVTNTSVTIEDNLVNAQTGSTLYDSAEIYNAAKINFDGIVRIRVVADGSLFTQAFALEVKMVTCDSIV